MNPPPVRTALFVLLSAFSTDSSRRSTDPQYYIMRLLSPSKGTGDPCGDMNSVPLPPRPREKSGTEARNRIRDHVVFQWMPHRSPPLMQRYREKHALARVSPAISETDLAVLFHGRGWTACGCSLTAATLLGRLHEKGARHVTIERDVPRVSPALTDKVSAISSLKEARFSRGRRCVRTSLHAAP